MRPPADKFKSLILRETRPKTLLLNCLEAWVDKKPPNTQLGPEIFVFGFASFLPQLAACVEACKIMYWYMTWFSLCKILFIYHFTCIFINFLFAQCVSKIAWFFWAKTQIFRLATLNTFPFNITHVKFCQLWLKWVHISSYYWILTCKLVKNWTSWI